jgi:hypothetical protein
LRDVFLTYHFLKTNELTHSPNFSNISSLSPLSSISNSSETNTNAMFSSKQNLNKTSDQRSFKSDWNNSLHVQQKNPSNVENEVQDFEKALDLKQHDFRQNQNLSNNSNKKIKSDGKQENENGLLQTFLASGQNLNNEVNMSTFQMNQMQQLNWLLSQKNAMQPNKSNQNATNLTTQFPNENFNCLNAFFNSNLLTQSTPPQPLPNLNNFQMNLNAYQMGKSPFGFNPFSMTNQTINTERVSSENAAILSNQAEMMISPKKILELLGCINLMSGGSGNNPMNLNAATAAALLGNQIKSGDSANNLNLIENQNVMAAAQQLNLALSSMSNAAGL